MNLIFFSGELHGFTDARDIFLYHLQSSDTENRIKKLADHTETFTKKSNVEV